MHAETVKRLAQECGFELAGIAAALPVAEASFYRDWVREGLGGEMRYLAGHRAEMRSDPRTLLASARSIVCVGKLYNGPQPYSTEFTEPERAWISRYAWGDDYHDIVRLGLERMAASLEARSGEVFEWRALVDTAPLLERAYARRAGLGWIGKNTCLIHEGAGSWFFLGEILVSLELEPDAPPPDRCGTCMRCIEACPTAAIVPTGRADPAWTLDSRRCISYYTIELRGPVPREAHAAIGRHVFGCDICQDVCPWNRRAPVTSEPAFAPRHFAPPLERLAALGEGEFREMFRPTPVIRARYTGFLRNVALAMGASGLARFGPVLENLAEHTEPLVRDTARAALVRLAAVR
ncbi:MAG TPA: tRNA epoxyqueuosine(34) reductase QueG [Bryobacteraceae bacterium]